MKVENGRKSFIWALKFICLTFIPIRVEKRCKCCLHKHTVAFLYISWEEIKLVFTEEMWWVAEKGNRRKVGKRRPRNVK